MERFLDILKESMEWYLEVLKNKYSVFSGRAGQKEFWMFCLFNAIITGVFAVMSPPFFPGLYFLATIVPSIAVSIRRLHDTGRSGWWLLLGLIPIIGFIVLFMAEKGKDGFNNFGENPELVKSNC